MYNEVQDNATCHTTQSSVLVILQMVVSSGICRAVSVRPTTQITVSLTVDSCVHSQPEHVGKLLSRITADVAL